MRRLYDNSRLIVGTVALLAVGVLVIRASSSAFTAATDNADNRWTAGAVELVDDAPAALFLDGQALAPGATETRCVTVTYRGTITPVDVRLYADTAGELSRYLDVLVERGTGGGYGRCAGFEPTTIVHRGTLDAMPTGWRLASSWRVDGSNTANTYRFAVTVPDDRRAQSTTARARFIWEARP